MEKPKTNHQLYTEIDMLASRRAGGQEGGWPTTPFISDSTFYLQEKTVRPSLWIWVHISAIARSIRCPRRIGGASCTTADTPWTLMDNGRPL